MATTQFKGSETRKDQVRPIPHGYHSLTPGLVVADVDQALRFYAKAFGAAELYRMDGPDGRPQHAEVRIGDSIFMLSPEHPGRGMRSPRSIGGTGVSLNLYLESADDTYAKAVAAGATVLQPVEHVFWGDRYGKVQDPDGHVWGLCTRVEDLTPDEITKRGREAMAKKKS